jgi:hypothetical protein
LTRTFRTRIRGAAEKKCEGGIIDCYGDTHLLTEKSDTRRGSGLQGIVGGFVLKEAVLGSVACDGKDHYYRGKENTGGDEFGFLRADRYIHRRRVVACGHHSPSTSLFAYNFFSLYLPTHGKMCFNPVVPDRNHLQITTNWDQLQLHALDLDLLKKFIHHRDSLHTHTHTHTTQKNE